MEIGSFLGLELKQRQKTEDMHHAIQGELLKLHQATVMLLPAVSRRGDSVGCRARLDALYEHARRKKLKRVRSECQAIKAKETEKP